MCTSPGPSPHSFVGMKGVRVQETSAYAQVLREDGKGALSAPSGASAECALAAAGSAASPTAWSPCSSNASYADLKDGDYIFTARTLGAGGNAAPQTAVSNFTVDTSAPAIQVWQLGSVLSPSIAPDLHGKIDPATIAGSSACILLLTTGV